MYQVKRLFLQNDFAKQIFRNIHRRPSVKILYPLESRGLIKVSGKDAPVFLQGLITNDMQHFEEGANSIYAMFLNNKGRVIYDTLIHKWEGNDNFLIECDKNILTLLQKHLKIYKLKRVVDFTDMSEKLKLFALISPIDTNNNSTTNMISKDVNIYKDPRLAELGHRVVTSKTDESHIATSFGDTAVIADDDTGYKSLRYKLGVSEGAEDLPPGTCFPLEANCDYLHGVSFHKGCYIGQELTARVHHTGVVRKRIMPLRFTDVIEATIEKDSVITIGDTKKNNVGKLKTFFNGYGLGLVRIKEALEATDLRVDKYSVEIIRPHWWPIEAPKEKASAKVE